MLPRPLQRLEVACIPVLVQGGLKGPECVTFFDSIPFTASFARYTPPPLNPYPLPDPLKGEGEERVNAKFKTMDELRVVRHGKARHQAQP